MLQIIKTSPHAKIPSRSTPQSAGFDLFSIESAKIEPHSNSLISIGLRLKIPDGYYGRIAPRSGISMTQNTIIGAGVIDADYTGIVKVLIHNLNNHEINIDLGVRIAQLIISPILLPQISICENLENTTRNEGGFGSTGLF